MTRGGRAHRTKLHARRFCFTDCLAREPKAIVGRRTLAGMEELDAIRLEKELLLVAARGRKAR